MILVSQRLFAYTYTLSYVHTFRSFTTQPNSYIDVKNPGLVEDGTKCDTDMACLSQECVSVCFLSQFQPCNLASNGQMCSGNGVNK